MRADSVLRSSFPSNTFLSYARNDINNARLRGVRVPIGGTYRMEVILDGEPRVFYMRVASSVRSLQLWARGVLDTALTPREPEGYYVQAAAAPSVAQLASSCESRTPLESRSVVAYVDLDWHGAGSADTSREWRGGLDPRLLESVLSAEERSAWRQRQRDGAMLRVQQMRAQADSLRRAASSATAVNAEATRQPFVFIPQRPLRVWHDAAGTLRIDGVMQIDQLGAISYRGERLSLDALPCS